MGKSPEKFRARVPKETRPYLVTVCTISLAKAGVNVFFRTVQETYFLTFTEAAHGPVTAIQSTAPIGFTEMPDGAAGGAHSQRWSDLFLVLSVDEPQNIPAAPMNIRTTVGASGESEQPPCACREVDAMRKARAERIMLRALTMWRLLGVVAALAIATYCHLLALVTVHKSTPL
jgi:hypothetical protein